MLCNHIPVSTWRLIGMIAVVCDLLVGYGSISDTAGFRLLPILPLLGAIELMFFSDIDALRHGIILVKPQNLISLAESPGPHPATAGDPTLPE